MSVLSILFMTSYYKPAYVYGGPARSIPVLCEGLQALGCQVSVFTTNANGDRRLSVPLSQPVDVDGVPVWYFPLKYNGMAFFYSPEQAQNIKNNIYKYDLIVTEAVWGHALLATASACNLHHKPYIISLRGQLMPWALKQKPVKKQVYLSIKGTKLLQGASALHCTNQNEADMAKRMGLSTPTFVLANGINLAGYENLPPKGSLRNRLGIPKDSLILLFLGRLHKNKRPDIATDVLKEVKSLGSDVRLVYIGPDEEGLMPAIKKKAHQSGCEKQVYFTGLLDQTDVIKALVDADLLLMPSEVQENFGMSAVEAMAAGVPILVSEGVPVGEDAQRAGAGRVVPCDPVSFSQAAIEMLSDREKLQRMGAARQIYTLENYDISVVAGKMLKQFQAIIETGRPISSMEGING